MWEPCGKSKTGSWPGVPRVGPLLAPQSSPDLPGPVPGDAKAGGSVTSTRLTCSARKSDLRVWTALALPSVKAAFPSFLTVLVHEGPGPWCPQNKVPSAILRTVFCLGKDCCPRHGTDFRGERSK